MQFSCKLIYNHLDCRVHYFHVSELMPIIGVCGNNQRNWCQHIEFEFSCPWDNPQSTICVIATS